MTSSGSFAQPVFRQVYSFAFLCISSSLNKSYPRSFYCVVDLSYCYHHLATRSYHWSRHLWWPKWQRKRPQRWWWTPFTRWTLRHSTGFLWWQVHFYSFFKLRTVFMDGFILLQGSSLLNYKVSIYHLHLSYCRSLRLWNVVTASASASLSFVFYL